MSEAITKWQDAIIRRKAAVDNVERVVKSIKAISDKLFFWNKAVVSNISGGGYPMELTMGGDPQATSINASTWPSAQELHDALVAFHKANAEVSAAWDAIPSDRRLGLSGPS